MEPTLSGFSHCSKELMCLAQGHKTVPPGGIEPRTSRFGIRCSTTTPPSRISQSNVENNYKSELQ